MQPIWKIKQPEIDAVRSLSRQLDCHPVVAAILMIRDITTPEKVRTFLNPSLANLRSPFLLKDIEAATERIAAAINQREKILLFGDYDVDGVTGTSILLDFLQRADADVSYYLPHRLKEGYSLQHTHIIDYVIPQGFNLIITTDCGAGSHQAVAAAQDAGVDVIITDHHITGDTLPPAFAVINPQRQDCDAGFGHLAGVGVSFYLLIALRKYLRDNGFWADKPEPNLKDYCDLVALGTVADIVPLVAENRILTDAGIDIINLKKRIGIKALIEASGLKNQPANAEDIAFKLAPRINAAGRMDHAGMAVELFTTQKLSTARKIATKLSDLNIRRREAEKAIFTEIEEYLEAAPDVLKKKSIVLSDLHSPRQWNAGILGIVASRLVKKYFRPVVLIAFQDGTGKGSARSIPGFNLYNGLAACEDVLKGFGGHSMAAGLKISPTQLAHFREAFDMAVRQKTEPDDFIPVLRLDYELKFDDIDVPLLDSLETLKPFGQGNPEPLFMARDIMVVSSKIVGRNHRKMVLSQSGQYTQNRFAAIQFNLDDCDNLPDVFDQIAFRLRWNYWNNAKTMQMQIEAVLE
ncbi:single-stranded-DNA-specific exonuclease RecJ [Desulfococcaceae bacterium HSG9]|nr:single-stranded-DNA-specific exonuclease RecJ [Desulfococcaceae bacterium HSG9]